MDRGEEVFLPDYLLNMFNLCVNCLRVNTHIFLNPFPKKILLTVETYKSLIL